MNNSTSIDKYALHGYACLHPIMRRIAMNICEQCGKAFKTPQALGAHRVLYHRADKADLEAFRAGQHLRDEKIADLEAEVAQKADRVKMLEAEHQASACPYCGKLVGWDIQPVQWYNESDLQNGGQSLFPFLFRKRGKRCPICHYFEEVKH